jgi:hypothetical protein
VQSSWFPVETERFCVISARENVFDQDSTQEREIVFDLDSTVMGAAMPTPGICLSGWWERREHLLMRLGVLRLGR